MNTLDETKELTTPTGLHKITVRAYLTGVDRRANRKLIWDLSKEGRGDTIEALEAAENALIGQILLSLDGSSESVLERTLALPAQDYDFVIDTVNEIAVGLDKKKEVISDGSTLTSSTAEK